MTKPSVGRTVHYVARGSADGVFPVACRAALITVVPDDGPRSEESGVSLAVFHPDGLLFAHGVPYNDGAEVAGEPDCAEKSGHGSPFRYCGCGWSEAKLRGGTWHWPERV